MRLIKKGNKIDWKSGANDVVIANALETCGTMRGFAKLMGITLNCASGGLNRYYEHLLPKIRQRGKYSMPELLAAIKSSDSIAEVSEKINISRSSGWHAVNENYPQHLERLLNRVKATDESIKAVIEAKGGNSEVARQFGVSVRHVEWVRNKARRLGVKDTNNLKFGA